MISLDLSPDYVAEGAADGAFGSGVIYHFAPNQTGRGGVFTPVGRFHVWNPTIGAEGYNPHQRIDCYLRDAHELAPDPAWMTRALCDALVRNGTVREPVWLGWHRSTELGGEPRGEVFDFD
jgi:hypothetical protein